MYLHVLRYIIIVSCFVVPSLSPLFPRYLTFSPSLSLSIPPSLVAPSLSLPPVVIIGFNPIVCEVGEGEDEFSVGVAILYGSLETNVTVFFQTEDGMALSMQCVGILVVC